MNIAVINLRDIFKYLVRISIIIIIIIVLTRFFSSINLNKQENIIKEKIDSSKKQITDYAFTECLDMSLSLMSLSKSDSKNERLASVNSILNLELGMLDSELLKSTDLKINQEELTIDDVEDLKNTFGDLPDNVTTERVDDKNLAERSTNSYGTVKIQNDSDYEITESMLIPDVQITNKRDIFIYHAHTCESYTPSEAFNYEMTGNYRTTDLNYTVARVGEELATCLKNKGFNVVHDSTYHDYPSYSGSYARALETAEKDLAGTDTQLVIDLHRDAVGNGSDYGPTIKVNGELAAQAMFVIGTDGGGLEHPSWVENLKMAVKIQEKANEMYPGLFRPIIVRNSRYNQHVTTGACIIEVGATGNTMEECILSMQCLANVYQEVCK